MATIIDSFLTVFGIDPKPFAEGAAEVRKETKKTREEIGASDKRLQEGGKRNREAIRGLRNEVTGLFLAFAGGSTLKGFFKDLVAGDAAVGRLANNLGVNATQLDAWGRMAKQAGGDAGDAAAAFTAMVQGFQTYRMTGRSPFDDDLRGLGVTLKDFQDPADALLKMAEAGERMDRAEFFTRLSNIGIPASVITTLSQGRAETEKLVDAMTRQSKVSQKSVADAQAFEAALTDLSDRIKDKVRPGLTDVINGFIGFLDQTDAARYALPAVIGVIGSLAAVTIAATWPWLALAGAIMAGVTAFDALLAKFPDVANWLDRIEAPLRAVLPAWLFDRPGERPGAPAAGPARMTFKAGGAGPAMVPKGQRAVALDGNNPGGINDGDFARRQPGYVGGNGRYAAFATLEDGLNAQRALIRSYVRRGFDTPTAIANRYAPAADGNDNVAYARNIAKQMGIGVNDRIGAGQIEAFVQAQARQENSRFASRYAGAAARPGATAAGRGFGNTVTIGQLTVQTQATDAEGIAAELPGAIRRRAVVFNANTGLD
jgi:hypothetical protein